jgi:hypothetical protein
VAFFTLELGTVVGQDKPSMPWTDENGELVPVGFSPRSEAITYDRDSVRLAPPRQAATTNWPSYDWSFLATPTIVTMFVIGVAIAIGLMVWLFVSMQLGEHGVASEDTFRRRTIEESIKQLPFELDANFGDFRTPAWEAYQAGNLRRSLILLFSHVLVTLDQRNLVHLKKGKTNRQYLKELKHHPKLAGYYGDVMVPFEQAFFGDHPVDQSVCEKCWNELEPFQANLDSIKLGGGND